MRSLIDALDALAIGSWGAAGLVVVLMLESAPVIGLFIPGVFLMVGLGSLSGSGYFSFADCVIFSSIGALLGDSLGYWIGYLGGERLLARFAGKRSRDSRRKAADFLDRHGRWAVFLGRFVWFFHPTVPLLAGVTGVRPWRFYLADVPAVILWVLLYAGIGHWATGLARERTLEFFTALGVLLAIVALVWLLRYLRGRHSAPPMQ